VTRAEVEPVPAAGHHPTPDGADAWLQAGPQVLVVAAVALGYLAAALHASAGARGWSRWRTAAWLFGCAVAAVALSPALADHDPRAHMARHLLLGMVAPLGLVLGAPVTLVLRIAGAPVRRGIGRVLRSRPVHVLGHPLTAALLNVGGLYAVMLTPLHRVAGAQPLLHLHYLAAGYLFTWAVAGPDPAPRRPGLGTRMVAFVLAAGAHAVLAKLLYADTFTSAGDAGGLRAAALLMYYGGDVAELALAVALFTAWYRRRAGLARGAHPARAPLA